MMRDNRKRTRRLLIKGVCFSLLFHLMFPILFHIRKISRSKEKSAVPCVFFSQKSTPIYIEAPQNDLSKNLEQFYLEALGILSPNEKNKPEMQICSSVHPFFKTLLKPVLPWGFIDSCAPSSYISHIYPLKITLHSSLRHLSFIEDGSTLFISRKNTHSPAIPLFPSDEGKTMYYVTIDPSSGKISSIHCKKNLSDRRLQKIADAILKTVSFHIESRALRKNLWEGKISIHFFGTYETVDSFIDKEKYPS